MAHFTLLTGATGLLGRYLLRNLLAEGVPVAVVVRPTAGTSAEERIDELLRLWDPLRLPKPVCLSGDLRSPDLGLDPASRAWVGEHCDSVVHSAAVLKFHASSTDGEPRTTNVEGTRNVLDLCRALDIRDLHHISTAYVSGSRAGPILEAELDEGQEFRNDYEASKLEAEKLVRAADHLDSATVYRPTVISGDSETGYTNTYHGLYLYLRLVAMAVPKEPKGEDGIHRTPIRLPMTGDEPRNVVPVDWVAAVVTHLFRTPAARGGTYHLAPDDPLTPRRIIDACSSYFNAAGVEYVGPDFEHDPSDMSDFERFLLENITIYDSYSATDPVFDTSELVRFAGHLPCPVIDEAMLHRYLDFALEDRWGRKGRA